MTKARDALGMPVPPAAVVEQANRFRNLLGRSHTKMVPPFALILERLFGLVDNKALGLMVELDIPDLLHVAPKTAQQLATETDTEPDALDRVLRFLVGRDLLGVTKDGRYTNNAASDFLRSDHPYSWRAWVEFFASEWNWQMWMGAMDILTGSGNATAARGRAFFDFVNENPEAAAAFNGAMRSGSTMQALLVRDRYDFSAARRLCDVGGGTGAVLVHLLEANSKMTGVLFELPGVIEQARPELEQKGILSRCELVEGNFFEAVAVQADIYTLFAVIHDWGDEEATLILGNIRDAMPATATVLVVEGVIPEDPHYSFTKVSDLLMLVYSDSGRERTLGQFHDLFRTAGFNVERVLKLPSLFRIFELKKA